MTRRSILLHGRDFGLLATILTAALSAQEPAVISDRLAHFAKLPAEQQAALVDAIERAILGDDEPIVQRLRVSTGSKGKPAAAVPWFDTATYAPSAAARHLVTADDPAHAAATRGIQGLDFGPTILAATTYDWRTGALTSRGKELTPTERLTNYLHGLPPNLDFAIAQTMATLDNDPEQRRLADYFGHAYADRDGRVFAGVTLFDAWHSGKLVEVPDTDAIAFARHLLGTAAFVTPIPADRRRARLYEKVRDGFAAHRAYRTLRLALAATFAVADPSVGDDYEPMIRRCHWLWQHCNNDPAVVANFLASTGDRSDALHQIDAVAGSDSSTAEARRAALRTLASKVSRIASDAVDGAKD